MKLKQAKELLEKINKYEELKEWRDRFDVLTVKVNLEEGDPAAKNLNLSGSRYQITLPDHVRQIILGALEAEINKMEEE